MLLDTLNSKTGDELHSAQKDLTMAYIRQQNEALQARIEQQEELMRQRFAGLVDRIEKVANNAANASNASLPVKAKVCSSFSFVDPSCDRMNLCFVYGFVSVVLTV
jgi:hypothetical protein